ncbi:RNA polymerase sigma factor [Pelosinus sp. sgz500959]|uniref:RNA polymerase sigma factor n=1 Tax=Pelosinus sp. sgz500959 TaxID=3242472 RepID=UPI00366BF4F6
MELMELVKKAQEGNEQAIYDICLRFTGLVKKYAFQPHIRPIAEDAQSQGWLAVVQGIKQYDAYCGVQFAGYIESRVKYAIWNLFKGERRRWQHEGQLEGNQEEGRCLLEQLADNTDVASEVEMRDLSQELMMIVAVLPDKQRQVILRTVIGDEKLIAVAAELGITAQGVYNLRKRGLTRLKKLCSGMYRGIRH